jgi:serine protease Do
MGLEVPERNEGGLAMNQTSRWWWMVPPVVLGALMLLGLPALMHEVAYAKEKGRAEAARSILNDEQIKVATSLSSAFQQVAQAVGPTVVTVQSTKSLRFSRRGHRVLPPEFENSPFRRFFDEGLSGPHGSRPDSNGGLRQQGTGSGVIVSADGYILTNNHVIDGSDEVTVVLMGGKKQKATLVGSDPKTDLAVLKIDASGLVTAPLGNSDALRVGEWVLAVGNPFNLEQTVTAGIVSAKGRANVGIADYEDFLQTDAAINPGNSGGPLVNLKGEVVGINTAIATNTGQSAGIGFAIPINMARSIKDHLIANGRVQRGYLGVMIQDLNEDLSRSFKFDGIKGVLVGDVVPDGPGDKAGLRNGDIVTRYDGREMESVQHLRNTVAETTPGKEVEIDVFRDGKIEKLALKVGELDGKSVASGKASAGDVKKLGMTLQTLTPELARDLSLHEGTRGVLIMEVEPDGLAAFAGLQPRQVVTSVNGNPVADVEQFGREVMKRDLKDGLRLHVKSAQGSRFVYLKDAGKK